MNILYETRARVVGGRAGHATVEDGALALTLATPRALGGGEESGTNPEQLFATSFAACFLSALRFVANRRRLALTDDSAVVAAVGIGMREDGAGFGLQVALSVSLPGLEPGLAAKLVEEADQICPYSHLARAGAEIRVAIDD
ncbi:Ohr family peroxiredoxin [Sphingomonas pokkalii]|uniref:Organic hydroperoxide resistance protein n=1 Tax=Sphingomonas pokkalii TaxID=2175090 RepID=A0A2U0SGU6_9SPHN|nr:Ohr family peroxiredoxin [Sphingomonas pokkalii]PVX30579.1 organic hydroperoxide resistance protein [Sphingomonas pokkalii]